MSIFGNVSPKIIVSGSGETIILDNCRFEKDNINNDIEHTSVLTGKNHLIKLGDYAEFNLEMELSAYADAQTKFLEIFPLYTNGTLVSFFIDRNANPIKDKNNNVVYFNLTKCNHVDPLADASLYNDDVLELTFKSIDYVDISKSVVS